MAGIERFALIYIGKLLGLGVSTDKEHAVTLFKRFKRQKPMQHAPKQALYLKSEHAPCTCPEPCERDHGNE